MILHYWRVSTSVVSFLYPKRIFLKLTRTCTPTHTIYICI